MGVAIKIEGYTKTYRLYMPKRLVNAVENLNLEVYEGEIFGFLGPNGAGKTTTIKMLLGLTYPTAGQAFVLGKPAGDIETKKEISYLPESPYFYEYMTGQEVLDFYGRLFGLDADTRKRRVEELLKTVGLYADRFKPLSQYSKGMLQRIGIAQALVNDPKLLFFDEPTSGLDPIAHMDIRDLILKLKEQGKTVFLSSHQLSDVEMVCDRISILNRGRLLKIGYLKDLLAHGKVEITAQGLGEQALAKLREAYPTLQTNNGSIVVHEEAGPKVDDAIDMIRQMNGRIISVIPQRRTLEDLFVETIREERR
ncbi:MAG: ABC transporter ATP-binding protein [Armatimonadota bacterium]|nr:ABC transporter ATP-binding protein [Armatimonadota bacterium]